jgi:hypothetical protein
MGPETKTVGSRYLATPSADINNREDLMCVTVFCEVGSDVQRYGLALSIGPNWLDCLPEDIDKSSLWNTALSKNGMMDNTKKISNCIESLC